MNKFWNSILCLSFLSFIPLMAIGCIAPGSSMGILKLNGHIENFETSENPLQVKVLLSKEYGLGGLDHMFGHPSDYGNSDSIEINDVNINGYFSFKHEVVYHISFYILPPLGALPKSPPSPFYAIGFSDCKDEIYLVSFENGKPNYRVYRLPDKIEISADQATWKIIGGSLQRIKNDEIPTLDIVLELKRTCD